MGLRVAVVLMVLCLVSAACGGWNKVEEASEELIWAEEVDLDKGSELGPAEHRMARIVYPVDIRLQNLIQSVQTLEPKKGSNADLGSVLSEFPWISGVVVVSPDGEVMERPSEQGDEPAALKQVAQKASQWRDRKLHALYGKGRYGRDVVMLKALYSSGRHTGYLVVAFDFSSLVKPSKRAKELVAVSQGSVLWPGAYDRMSKLLAEKGWDERLDNRASGRCRIENRIFLWMARYIGQDPFFYAVEVQGEK